MQHFYPKKQLQYFTTQYVIPHTVTRHDCHASRKIIQFMNKLILIFAFIGIITIHSAKAQQNIRDKFLVDKIYIYDGSLAEYIYDMDNKLIKKIITGQFMEQGQLRDLKNIYIFEYEYGRVSKIIHYDSTHFMFDYETHFFYNPQGQLIRMEGHKDGSIYEHLNYHYENGRVVSIYPDGIMPLQYDTIFYDHAGNVTKRTWSLISNPIWRTNYFEYDNNPRPNFGIDYLFTFQPLAAINTDQTLEMCLSKNNMTKGRGNIWIYTYNEYGLPDTYWPKWESNPSITPTIMTIEYKQITSGISEPARSKLVVYPNPTRGELRVTRGQVNEWTSERINGLQIFDIYGRHISLSSCPLVHSSTITMDISHLPAGVYFLRVGGETVKVVKQ